MEGEENAESRFFGSTLEERAAQERAKNDAADAPAERKFFGGETLEL